MKHKNLHCVIMKKIIINKLNKKEKKDVSLPPTARDFTFLSSF